MSSRLAGFFQRDSGQYSCINCDNVGNFYQQETSATVRRRTDAAENNTPTRNGSLLSGFRTVVAFRLSQVCFACPTNTMRYAGKGSSANVTSCLCEKGQSVCSDSAGCATGSEVRWVDTAPGRQH